VGRVRDVQRGIAVQGSRSEERMTHYQRIKQEYQEPLREIIKAYAIQGHSRRAVAQILEVSQMTGLRMIKRYNCDQYFRPYKDMRPEAKNRWGRSGRPSNPAGDKQDMRPE
jgi:DNA invertase Pin-like site-specific DNA recombinase